MRIRLCLSSFLLLIVFAVFFSFSASAESYYTVSYNANGGSNAPDSQTKTQGQPLTLSTIVPTRTPEDTGNGYTVTFDPNGGSIGTNTLTARVMRNYTFQNWNTRSFGIGTSYLPGEVYSADADVTLYAQWSSRVSTETITLPNPKRSGYTFLGWAENSEAFSGVIGSYTPTEDITLYAIWEEGASGTWGSLSWALNSTGTLTISGEGEMADFSSDSSNAWCEYRDSIKTVEIENGVTSISSYAFYECYSLTSVTIPDSVTNIGECAFYFCSGLDAVYINDLAAWCRIAFDDWSSSYFSSNPLYYAHKLFLNGDLLTNLEIPEDVTIIKCGTFFGCALLTSVTIPDSVTSIGDYAFCRCSGLTSITIPESVTSIGSCVFADCSGLTSITIPDSVTSIGGGTFTWCSGLISVTIPSGVTSIGNFTFENCRGLTSVTIPDSVTSIGNYAFYRCSGLTSVTIPHSVTSIGEAAFSDCTNLTCATTPLWRNFDNCPVTHITIPDSVTNIGNEAFAGCSGLTSITIPDSVTSIGECVFANCSGLTSITIPDSVTSIGGGTFQSCSGLKNVTIPNGVTSIDWYTFYECRGLTNVIIPDSVTSIGIYAFFNCYGLTSVTIGNGVTDIGHAAFGRSGLISVTIKNGVTRIGNEAFRDCISLTSVTIGNSVTSIGRYAFRGCSGLMSFTIPNSVTSIGDHAFDGCSGLTDVYYEGTQEQWNSIRIDGVNDYLIDAVRHYFYRVSFNSNGGTTVSAQMINPDEKAVKPADPTKEGFLFVGWYMDKDFSLEFDFDATITESITLYAKWFGPDLILPAALTVIGEESFAGGSFSYVQLSEHTISIKLRAFANCPNLIFIYIPEATTDIDPQAFGDKHNLTIFGKSGSVADDYALEHGFRFVDYP